MLSLGDERLAAPGVTLLYHVVRIPEVTRHGYAALGASLERIDELWIAQLLEWALENRLPRGTHACDPADAPVLLALLGPKAMRRCANRPAGELARDLERHVAAAVAKGKHRRLARLNRRLFEINTHISAHVACIQRLVDRDHRSGRTYHSRVAAPLPADDAELKTLEKSILRCEDA